MTKKTLALVLGTSLLALSACGKKEVAAPDSENVAEAPQGAPESTSLDIPPPPPNPLLEVNAEKSAAFLAANGARPGVITEENGLQIEITAEGEGDTPVAGDYVSFHYDAKFIDGRVFDSSRKLGEPLMVPTIDQIPIPGVPQALGQMKEGSSATITVPPDLAYAEQGVPGLIEPNSALIFDLELIEVVTQAEPERRAEIEAEQQRLMEEARAKQAAEQAKAREAFNKVSSENLAKAEAYLAGITNQDGVIATDSGLAYEVLTDGGQGETPDPWDTVRVHYSGTLTDGTEFDSSYARGEPIEFPLNGVIAGWTEGVGLMNVGDKYKFHIPPGLGYGERGAPGGAIGPNEALVFEVELLGITQGKAPAE